MPATRRRFSKEFKLEAVRQLQAGSRLVDVARALGVNPTVLRRWQTQVKVDPVVMEKPGTPVPDPDKKAIELLRKLSKEDFGDPLLREDGTWTLDVKTRAEAAPPPRAPRG